MREYREIEYYGNNIGLPIFAFDKIDGSNLRFEYSPKRGFYKFGTRQMMIDNSHEEFGFAVTLFTEKYSNALTKIFKSKEYRNELSITCYAELIGEQSEFGQHKYRDDKFDIILFDVELKNGFIPPKRFYKEFKEVGIPKLVYQGNLNHEFVDSVKRNEYDLKEGVVCKGVIPNKKENNIFYCKIKTDDWFKKLQEKHPDLYIRELRQTQTKN